MAKVPDTLKPRLKVQETVEMEQEETVETMEGMVEMDKEEMVAKVPDTLKPRPKVQETVEMEQAEQVVTVLTEETAVMEPVVKVVIQIEQVLRFNTTI